MSLRGTIESGRLVLDDGTRLPEGTRVEVSIAKKPRAKSGTTKTTPGPLARLVKYAVNTGITDLAKEHDHYLYGTPKRGKTKAGVKGKARVRTKRRRSAR